MSEETKINNPQESGLPGQDVLEATEYDLVKGLLEAANYKEDKSLQKKIDIKRNGKILFSFTVRPLSEEDVRMARKKSTVYMPNPADSKLPAVEKEVNYFALRSWNIYLATLDEDREKIWNNPAIKEKFNVLQGVDTIDLLLTGGEKALVTDIIDNISGYDLNLEEYAKN